MIDGIPPETRRSDLVGDGYDSERLLTAEDVARWLRVSRKQVYLLDIPRLRLGARRLRWRPQDVREWLAGRRQEP